MKKYPIVILCILIFFTGCSPKNYSNNEENISLTTKEDKEMPIRIVTFTPAIVDFINYFDIDAEVYVAKDIKADKGRNIHELKYLINSRNFKKYIQKDIVPKYIFTTDNERIYIDMLKSLGNVIDYGGVKENYYKSLEDSTISLGKFFNIEKEVRYFLYRLKEKRRILFDKARKYGYMIELDDYFDRIKDEPILESTDFYIHNNVITYDDENENYYSIISYNERIDNLLEILENILDKENDND